MEDEKILNEVIDDTDLEEINGGSIFDRDKCKDLSDTPKEIADIRNQGHLGERASKYNCEKFIGRKVVVEDSRKRAFIGVLKKVQEVNSTVGTRRQLILDHWTLTDATFCSIVAVYLYK